MKDAVLHDLNSPGAQRFTTLSAALKAAHATNASGYIVDPANCVIELRKGKRRSADGKTWVPCFPGETK